MGDPGLAFDRGITVKPEVMLIEDVLGEVASGRLRVPRFQRPFVWRPEQMADLFDSIDRGFPIGSLLVWETDEELASLDTVGGLPVPTRRDGNLAYVLDGHQRLSTLFGTLRRPADSPRGAQQADWIWWVYRELGAKDRPNPFVHWKYDRRPPRYLSPM